MQKCSLKPLEKAWAWIPLAFSLPLKSESEKSWDGRAMGCFTLAQSSERSGLQAAFGGLARLYAPDDGSSSLAGASHWGISLGWRGQKVPWEVGGAYLKRVSESQDLKSYAKYLHLDGESSALCFYAQYLLPGYGRCLVFGQPYSSHPRGGFEGFFRFRLLPLKVAQGFLSFCAEKWKNSSSIFQIKVRVKLWSWLSGQVRIPFFSKESWHFSIQAEARDEDSPLSNFLEDAANRRHFFSSTKATSSIKVQSACDTAERAPLAQLAQSRLNPSAQLRPSFIRKVAVPDLKQKLALALPLTGKETFAASSPSPLNEALRSVPHTPIGHKTSIAAATLSTTPPLIRSAETPTPSIIS